MAKSFIKHIPVAIVMSVSHVSRYWASKKESPPLVIWDNHELIYWERGRCWLLKNKEFVYVGDPVPELDEQEHAAFLMNIQKSILLSLEQRRLLTPSQRERCLVELEKRYIQSQKKQRRA